VVREVRQPGRISNAMLVAAIDQAERGLVEADLGGGLIKQRVAREGGGKSGGYRTLVFFREGGLAVFAFGFARVAKPISTQLNCGPTNRPRRSCSR
jgi:hypothetical protein